MKRVVPCAALRRWCVREMKKAYTSRQERELSWSVRKRRALCRRVLGTKPNAKEKEKDVLPQWDHEDSESEALLDPTDSTPAEWRIDLAASLSTPSFTGFEVSIPVEGGVLLSCASGECSVSGDGISW